MKIIDKNNFFSVVCTVFTLLVLGKVAIESIMQGIFDNDQVNLLVMFVLSVLATFVLSQHYRFRNSPLFVVIVVQYLILIGAVMLIMRISGYYEPIQEGGYRDMFWSFTIPYAIGVIVYYASLFHEIGCMNRMLKSMKRNMK